MSVIVISEINNCMAYGIHPCDLKSSYTKYGKKIEFEENKSFWYKSGNPFD